MGAQGQGSLQVRGHGGHSSQGDDAGHRLDTGDSIRCESNNFHFIVTKY